MFYYVHIQIYEIYLLQTNFFLILKKTLTLVISITKLLIFIVNK